MKHRSSKILFNLISIMTVLVFSLFSTVPVFADDATPPAPTEEPTQPPTEEPVAVTGPIAESTEEPVATTEPAASSTEEAVNLPEVLEQLPEDTQVVVLDETGEVQPLASQDSASLLASGDPMWCPAGFLPGASECTPGFNTFTGDGGLDQGLIPFLTANAGTYGGAGTIYVAQTYDSSLEQNDITMDGNLLSLTDLIVQGGWDFGANAVVGTSFVDDYGISFSIYNWDDDVSIFDMSFNGSYNVEALSVTTTGDIALDNVQANENYSDYGAHLAGVNVTVTNSQFNSNGDFETDESSYVNYYGTGLYVEAFGNATLSNVTANYNLDTGAALESLGTVSITNSVFNGNGAEEWESYSNDVGGVTHYYDSTYGDGNGLVVFTLGDTVLANVTANDNYYVGAVTFSWISGGGVTVFSSQFNENGYNARFSDTYTDGIDYEYTDEYGEGYGLHVMSPGSVTLNQVSASNNLWGGAGLLAFGPITVSNSQFNSNGSIGVESWYENGVLVDQASYHDGIGLTTESSGPILIEYVTASNNLGIGHEIILDPVSVTVKCSTYNNNSDTGLDIDLGGTGAGALYGVTATGNGTNIFVSGGTVTEYPGFNCKPDVSSGKKDSGLPIHVLPVAGNLDCKSYSGTLLVLPNGDRALFPCPLQDEGRLEMVTDGALPGSLPGGMNFASSFTVHLLKNGVKQKEVDPFIIVSFSIPEGVNTDSLAILYWNGTAWVEVENAYVSPDGYFEAPVNFTGTFMLVTR